MGRYSSMYFDVVLERQVGDDEPVDAVCLAGLAQAFEPVLHDRVEVAHEDEGDTDFAPHVFQLVEQAAEGHAAPESLGGGILYDGPVCHGVAKGDSDFYQVDALRFEGTDYFDGIVGFRASGTKVNRKNAAALLFE